MSFLMDSDMLERKEEEEKNDKSSVFCQDWGIENVIISSECNYLIAFYLYYFNIIGYI